MLITIVMTVLAVYFYIIVYLLDFWDCSKLYLNRDIIMSGARPCYCIPCLALAPASVHETRAPSARLNKVSCSLVCTFTKQCHGHVVGSRVRPSTWAALTFVLALFLEPLHMYSNAMLRWFYLAPLEHLRGDPLKRHCTNCHNEWMNMFSEIQWRMFWH